MSTRNQGACLDYLRSLSVSLAGMLSPTLHLIPTNQRYPDYVNLLRRAKNFVLVVVLLLGSSGCDYIYFEYTHCGYYDDPRFDRAILSQPVLNQVYADQLRLVFDSGWHSKNVDYRLEFSGRLPPGITYYQNNGNVVFEGTATALGAYSFTATVIARYTIYDRHYTDLCSYRTTQHYQWVVASV